jgi:hypothetical protein
MWPVDGSADLLGLGELTDTDRVIRVLLIMFLDVS